MRPGPSCPVANALGIAPQVEIPLPVELVVLEADDDATEDADDALEDDAVVELAELDEVLALDEFAATVAPSAPTDCAGPVLVLTE